MGKTIYQIKDRVAVITMNSPETLNAIDDAMVDSLFHDLSFAETDPSVKAILILGNGKIFSSGGNLKNMKTGLESNSLDFNHSIRITGELIRYMKQLPKPIVIGIHKAAAGAGFSLAMGGDICVASKDAKFISSFVKVGLVPDSGLLFLLSRSIGLPRTIQLAMTGEPVDAIYAEQLGIVYKTCPPEQLSSFALALANDLSKGPASAFAQIKQLEYADYLNGFDSFIEWETAAQVLCGDTQDFREGVQAFFEKRKPEFL